MFNNRAQGVEGVVEALKSQHEQIKTVFFHVMGAQGQARQQAFLVARQLLALHEVVEEEIVHPAARASLVSGPSIVADRHKEEERALVMISELGAVRRRLLRVHDPLPDPAAGRDRPRRGRGGGRVQHPRAADRARRRGRTCSPGSGWPSRSTPPGCRAPSTP